MAVYGRALSADEVAQHYGDWLQHKPQRLQGARALYTFDERAGDIVHNHAGSAPNLIIPPTFKPLHPTVLAIHIRSGYTGSTRSLTFSDSYLSAFSFVPI